MLDVVARTAERIFMPLTVGGGVRTLDDIRALLRAGADKVSINTAAVQRPELVARGGRALRQPVHRGRDRRAAARVHRTDRRAAGRSYTHGGRRPTGLDALEWAARGGEARRGRDPAHQHGPRRHRHGYDLELTRAVAGGDDPRDRLGRRRARSSISTTAWSRAAPTPCWRRRSFTTASTRSGRPRTTCGARGVPVRLEP